MTLTEKVQCSSEKDLFTLFKEGIFYKCYNEDAMLFKKHIKPYRINVKYIKNLNAEVLSLGFPVSETGKGNLPFEEMAAKITALNFEVGTESVR
jgi:hypothetical protein